MPHGAAFPSFAYRFETADGAVVFSGDTSLTPNNPTLAHGADILVHEVVDSRYFLGMGLPESALQHMLKAHTDVRDIGTVARRAEVPLGVLSHIAPADHTQVSPVEGRRHAKQTTRW